MSLKKPFPGILAFFIVLLTMPLGHAFMILMEKIFGQEYVYPATTVLGIFGVILLIVGLKKEKEITATFYGLFAGLCIWTAVEILGRWNIFKEIWIEPLKYTLEMIIFLVVFVVLILILLTERKSRQRAESRAHRAWCRE